MLAYTSYNEWTSEIVVNKQIWGMNKCIELYVKYYSDEWIKKWTTPLNHIDELISEDFTNCEKLEWSSKIFSAILLPFRYGAICTFWATCTPIIV